jgi:hypothetical protein
MISEKTYRKLRKLLKEITAIDQEIIDNGG